MIIDDVIAAVTAAKGAEASAVVFANSVPGLIQTAVAAALANGATAAQLAPLAQLATDLTASNAALVAAIAANAPPTP